MDRLVWLLLGFHAKSQFSSHYPIHMDWKEKETVQKSGYNDLISGLEDFSLNKLEIWFSYVSDNKRRRYMAVGKK